MANFRNLKLVYVKVHPIVLLICAGTLANSQNFLKETKEADGQNTSFKGPATATFLNGAPVPSLSASLTVGPHGPILLSDSTLLENIAMFNREATLPRVVHAKGCGAHGYFQVTHNISRFTKAKLFSSDGKLTPTFVRFSTTDFKSGSPDTAHDSQGFSIKFYTEEGNLDLAGSSFPVAPAAEPMKAINAYKSRQKRSSFKDGTCYWDFLSKTPEAVHEMLMLYSEHGFPNGFRHINGYPIHAFRFINESGSSVFIKYHFLSDQGRKTLSPENATLIAGTIPDYAALDLYQAIHRGKFPSWTLHIQVMTKEQSVAQKWDPFDPTKLWPTNNFPLIEVGKLVLNKLPVNRIAEVDQSAFSPGNFVPGIEPSPDRLLQARIYAYSDAQRHRLGKMYYELPINKPLVPVHTYSSDSQSISPSGPLYYPNSFGGPQPDSQAGAEYKYFQTGGTVSRFEYNQYEPDYFSQPRELYQGMTVREKHFLIKRIVESLVYATKEIQESVIQNLFIPLDTSLAKNIQLGLNSAKPDTRFEESLRNLYLVM